MTDNNTARRQYRGIVLTTKELRVPGIIKNHREENPDLNIVGTLSVLLRVLHSKSLDNPYLVEVREAYDEQLARSFADLTCELVLPTVGREGDLYQVAFPNYIVDLHKQGGTELTLEAAADDPTPVKWSDKHSSWIRSKEGRIIYAFKGTVLLCSILNPPVATGVVAHAGLATPPTRLLVADKDRVPTRV